MNDQIPSPDGDFIAAEEILEGTSDAFFALDRRGCFTYVNRGAERLLGRGREELLGRNVWEEFPPGIGSRFQRESHRALEENVPAEYVEFYPPLNAWFEVRSFPTAHGHSVYFRDVTLRLEAERERQALLESLEGERRTAREVFEQLPVGVAVWNATGQRTFANQRMREILGRDVPDDLRELPLTRETGEPLSPAELPTLRVLRTGEVIPELLLRTVRPDGRELILRCSAGPMKDARGEISASMVVAQDVTEQRLAEEALLRSVRRFRSLVEATPAVVWVTDSRGELAEDSPSWRAFTGQSREEHEGGGWMDAIHPGDRDALQRAWVAAVAAKAAFEVEVRLRRRDGGYAHTLARWAPVLAGDGETVREWIRSNIDITARKQVEEALRQETELVEALNRVGARLAAELDLHKLVQLLTDEATRLLGAGFGAFFQRRPDEQGRERCLLWASAGSLPESFKLAPRSPCGDLFPGKETVRVEDLGASGDPRFLALLPAGSPVRSLLSAPVLTRAGEHLGGLLFGHPAPGMFTEKQARLLGGLVAQATVALENARLYETTREAEERAQRAAKLGEEFMGILGHDLRTPLQAVTLSANLLLTRGGLEETQRKTVRRIANNADRMGRLVSDLLDFTRVRLGQRMPVKLGPTNLHDVCRRAAEEFEAAHPDGKLVLQLSGDGAGTWDPQRMEQVLSNLLDNASKYSAPGATVEVRCGGDADAVFLEIHNEGRPIPPESLDTLFEPGRRAAGNEGTARSSLGLGLYIVREILRAHGGDIGVRSSEEEGTTFIAHLPRTPRE